MDVSSLFKEYINEEYKNEVQAIIKELDLHLISLQIDNLLS
jgi:hypothetical protein